MPDPWSIEEDLIIYHLQMYGYRNYEIADIFDKEYPDIRPRPSVITRCSTMREFISESKGLPFNRLITGATHQQFKEVSAIEPTERILKYAIIGEFKPSKISGRGPGPNRKLLESDYEPTSIIDIIKAAQIAGVKKLKFGDVQIEF